VGDAPMLPELLGQIPADEVSGHGARGGYGINASVAGVIPFRISFMQQSRSMQSSGMRHLGT
jgi:hypothetical protein